MKHLDLVFTFLLLVSAAGLARADKQATKSKSETKPIALTKNNKVLLDKQNKRLLLKTQVVLREGLLEMLLCKKQTKEHESILSIDAPAYVIHTGLLALGCKAGTPVKFEPEFQFPKGQQIEIYLNWEDKKGKLHREKAQKWIRHVTRRFYFQPLAKLPADLKFPEDSNIRYDSENKELSWFGIMAKKDYDQLIRLSTEKKYQAAIKQIYQQSQPKPMTAHWVFAGSGFYKDDQTGQRVYLAEEGYLICVANFGAAMLDVAQKSSATGETNLLFEANPSQIPPLGTEVTVELLPVKNDKTKQPVKKP